MAPLTALVQRSFGAGELAPAYAARADLARYTTGLRTCRNAWVQKSGGVANRPGFRFIDEVKHSSTAVRLYRWTFTAAERSTLIEVGDLYMRFYQNGTRLTVSDVDDWSAATAYAVGDLAAKDGINYYCILAHTNHAPPNATYWYALDGDIYEIPTPYTAGSFDSPGPLRFSQNGAALTITHPGYAPRQLQNLTGSEENPRWTLELIAFAPETETPANLVWTPGIPGPSGGHYTAYVITAIDEATGEESLPTAVNSASGVGLPTEETPNALSWDAVTGAREYRVYKDDVGNGTLGYIGTATGQETFTDTGFAPDYALTPPIARNPFNSSLDYPEIGAFYQQRQLFAYTHNQPSTVWGSRTGYARNFTIRSPLQDDDAITFTLASLELNVIRHLIPLKRLVLLTDGGEWVVEGDETGVLTPFAINPDQHGYAGSSRVAPVIVGSTVVFLQARDAIVRDLMFDSQAQSALGSRDLTIDAGHLFEGYTIGKLAYQQVPHSIVWAVRNDGTLLGLTYVRELDAWGWHRHDTAAEGVFEDVCVVPESAEDVLYALVRRTIDGETKRYIERLESRHFTDDETPFFVDAGIRYHGPAVALISGLDHLEGEEVVALADGKVQGPFTVESGAVTLPIPAERAHVGLAITVQFETLDLDVSGTGLRPRQKRVQALTAIVNDSAGGFSAGPDLDHLRPQRRAAWQPATGLFSGQFEVNLAAAFTPTGRVVIQHTDPTPLTLLALIPIFEVGG